MLKSSLLKVIRAYRKFISPLLGRHCRFIPSCSEYCLSAVDKHGILRGLALTVWRVLRCNPCSKGGADLP